MKNFLRISLVITGLVLLGVSAARAEIIDFDEITSSGGNSYATLMSYSYGGFIINSTLPDLETDDFFVVPLNSVFPYYLQSPDLIIQYQGKEKESAILSSESGNLFTLNSLFLRGLDTQEQTVRFSAFDAGNELIGYQDFTFADNTTKHKVNFGSTFQNIAQVRWQQTDPYYAVDTIDLTPNVVPEPVSLLLFGLGGVTLAAFRGSRRKEGPG